MRLMRAMRSSEYKTNPDSPFILFYRDLLDRIGEEPHRPPSIFSFFGPNYVASGKPWIFFVFFLIVLNNKSMNSHSRFLSSIAQSFDCNCPII